jgi:hypothetical protein
LFLKNSRIMGEISGHFGKQDMLCVEEEEEESIRELLSTRRRSLTGTSFPITNISKPVWGGRATDCMQDIKRILGAVKHKGSDCYF